MYYLQSRYYDPQIGRFINADVFVSTGQGILGNNMFAYCNNNPVNAKDPSGQVLVSVSVSFYDDPTLSMFFGGGGGYAFAGFSSAKDGIKKFEDFVTNESEATAQQNLKKHGMSFYKGVPVFMVDLSPFDRSGFSFGIIILDDYYEQASHSEFAVILNHESGHAKHMKAIGPVTYALTTALPSLACAGISRVQIPIVSQFVSENYYSFPWEHIADYYGGINRGYAEGANTLGTLYWVYTIFAGIYLP